MTYPGPIGSVISAGLLGGSDFGNLAQASSLCGACKEACPVDIDLPKLLLRVRAGQAPKKEESGRADQLTGGVGLSQPVRQMLRLYAWTAWHPALFSFAERLMGRISARSTPRRAATMAARWSSVTSPGPSEESVTREK